MGVLLQSMQHPQSTQYNLPNYIFMPLSVNQERVARAVRTLVDTFPELRTRFVAGEQGEVRQWSDPSMPIPVVSRKCTEAELQAYADKAATAAAAAQKTADAAQTKAQVDAAIEAAKTAAQAAAKEYADQVASAAKTDAAKDAYDQAKAYVDAEVAKVTATIPTEAAIKAIADASAAALDEALATEIDAIDVKGQVDEAVAKAIEKIDTAADNVAAIWSAVTSVEFAGISANEQLLNLQYGKQKFTYTFGNKKEAGAYIATAEPYSYKENDSIIVENDYVLRVNPVNATLNAADIKLINTLGDDINKYVNISVKKFTDLVTRATETGLWTVSISLKDDVKVADFQKDAKIILMQNGDTKSSAVYAIAINNTTDAAAGRYAATPFQLEVKCNKYVPATSFTFAVNKTLNAQLHNRWSGEYVQGEDLTIERDNPELAWKNAESVGITVSESTTKKDASDVRLGKDVADFELAVGENIVVDLSALSNKIDRYYVLFDKNNAVESAPSEWEAWDSYGVTGLGEIKKSSEKLTITIPSEKAVGDVLGFRVYAINYDGSLADPDGKAFYVKYGPSEEVASGSLVATVKANAKIGRDADFLLQPTLAQVLADLATETYAYNACISAVDLSEYDFTNVSAPANTGTFTIKAGSKVKADVTGTYWLLKSDKKTLASKWSEVAYMAASVDNIDDIVDGETVATNVTLTVADNDHHGQTAYKIGLSIKKDVVPAKASTFSWKSGLDITGGVLTVYATPYDATNAVKWDVAASYGLIDFAALTNNIDANYSIELSDANVLNDGKFEKVDTYKAQRNDGASVAKATAEANKITTGKKVVLTNAADYATGTPYQGLTYNDNAGFVLKLQGPDYNDGVTWVGAKGSYVNGTHTSNIKVVYSYPVALSRTSTSGAAVNYKSEVGTEVSKVKFSYDTYGVNFRWAKYQYAKAWNAGEVVGSGTVYKVTSWGTSSDYKLQWGKTAGLAFGYSAVAVAKPTAQIAGNAVDPNTGYEYQFDGTDNALLITGVTPWNHSLDYTFPVGGITVATGANAALDLTKLLVAEYSEGSTGLFVPARLLPILASDGTTTAVAGKLLSDRNSVAEYYNALTYYPAVGQIGIGTTVTEGPIIKVPSKLFITGMDCFGQEIKITLPITVEP